MCVYSFRNCLLNTIERVVIRDNHFVDMTGRTFDVLEFLIENAGKLVTKDEILGSVWTGSIVEESNLPVHISKLRRLLAETKRNRFIETVQGVGYRFIAPVEIVSEEEWRTYCSKAILQYETDMASQTSGDLIAVMPLRTESATTDIDYVLDGLTEGLINQLSLLPDIKIIARNTVFRYKGKDIDAKSVGTAIGASKLLLGSVRCVSNRLKISVELVDTIDSTRIWGDTLEGSVCNILELQEQLAESIANILSTSVINTRRRFGVALTRNPESYRLYLKGRYSLETHSEDGMRRAVKLFTESLRLDPENIHAYTEIVECYRTLHYFDYINYEDFSALVKPVVQAVSTRNQLVDVVQIMHSDLKLVEWKFEESLWYCKSALGINPNSINGRLRYSNLLLLSRKFEQALAQLEMIVAVDPLSPVLAKRLGRLFYLRGDLETAIAYCNDALDLEPRSQEAMVLRAVSYAELGNHEKALTDFHESFQLHQHREILSQIGIIYAKQGRLAKANRIMEKMRAEKIKCPGSSINLARLYLALGKTEGTFMMLEEAYARHEPDMRCLNYDRAWDPIRDEPRFRELVRKVGLPDLDD